MPFHKTRALEADPPHGPKMTWSHGRCRRRSSCSECEQCDGMGVIRPLTRDSCWAVFQLGRAAGGSSLGCGCCGYPKFFLGKLHMRLKQKSLEGREFRDKVICRLAKQFQFMLKFGVYFQLHKGEDVYKSFKWVDTTNFEGKISWHLLHDVAVGSDGPCLVLPICVGGTGPDMS